MSLFNDNAPSKKSKGESPKKGLVQTINGWSSKQKLEAMLLIAVIGIGGAAVPLIINYATTGSFFGIVSNPNLYIGDYQIQLNVYNSSDGTYYPVSGTVNVFDYYNETSLANITANGSTVYHAANVTFGYVTSVASNDGLIYPNATFLIRANVTAPQLDKIYLRSCGNSSDFNASIIKLNDVSGYFHVSDFIAVNEENFTVNMTNFNYNVSIGQRNYVPPSERHNVNCTYTTLWMYINCFPTSVLINNYTQGIYYNGTGTFIDTLPALNNANSEIQNFTLIECNTLPTKMEFIDGQFDGTLLKTLV